VKLFDRSDRLWREYHTALKEIAEGEPLQHVTHKQSTSIEAEGFVSLIRPEDRDAFDKTKRFGEIANGHVSTFSPWRIQEICSPLITHYDDPAFGRNYIVFYNKLDVGRATIEASYSCLLCFLLNLNIQYARFIPYGELVSLLDTLGFLMSDTPLEEGLDSDFQKRRRETRDALLAYLWESVRQPAKLLPLELRMTGPALPLLQHAERRAAIAALLKS
jgi:hypothetical protein